MKKKNKKEIIVLVVFIVFCLIGILLMMYRAETINESEVNVNDSNISINS